MPVLKRDDGTLPGDQFDGAGFVRGVLRKEGANWKGRACCCRGPAVSARRLPSLAGCGCRRAGPV
ncbi:hypothetical protein ACRAWF_08880 [Streptomyces sp. L7]